MPIDDERAAWLAGLRTADRAVHQALDGEVAAREISALHERIAALQAQVASLRGSVRVRDSLLDDHRVAIAERDARIDALGTPPPVPTLKSLLRARAVGVVRRVARLPRRLVRSAGALVGGR
ncbi:hypothetical protein [Cellulomonas sp. Leaf395]|uniref:hypothetical protein n=1 Tax=Cellulomonas sp. Leaf395 TaxID=1736362 RepID=UPI0006F91883|nr:hypothetical protein [Cellulomonas sp. Leaf395]KQS99771.1 hypothetical protein ASG23_10600 [Cellulomonas sp. Leaf395]